MDLVQTIEGKKAEYLLMEKALRNYNFKNLISYFQSPDSISILNDSEEDPFGTQHRLTTLLNEETAELEEMKKSHQSLQLNIQTRTSRVKKLEKVLSLKLRSLNRKIETMYQYPRFRFYSM